MTLIENSNNVSVWVIYPSGRPGLNGPYRCSTTYYSLLHPSNGSLCLCVCLYLSLCRGPSHGPSRAPDASSTSPPAPVGKGLSPLSLSGSDPSSAGRSWTKNPLGTGSYICCSSFGKSFCKWWTHPLRCKTARSICFSGSYCICGSGFVAVAICSCIEQQPLPWFCKYCQRCQCDTSHMRRTSHSPSTEF